MDKLISIDLAKKLFENGCEFKSEYYWTRYIMRINWKLEKGIYGKWELHKGKKSNDEVHKIKDGLIFEIENIPAYDIMNEICIKYAKEFFGTDLMLCEKILESLVENRDSVEDIIFGIEKEYKFGWGKATSIVDDIFKAMKLEEDISYEFHSKAILVFLQDKDIEYAEKYIWWHCGFNEKKRDTK